jgi:ABC-type branched-subunit amino acid transport system ATPase component
MMLEVQELTAGYEKIDVLFDVSLNVKEGEFITIIGPNGAGKTTLMKAIIGVIPIRKGKVIFKNHLLNDKPPSFRLTLGIGYIPQEEKIFPKMSVLDNLRIGGYTLTKNEFQQAIERVYTLFPVLKEKERQEAGSLSGGERQMLAIGRALMVKLSLLLLDEPTLGLQPSLVIEVLERISQLNQEGISILLVAQTKEAAQIAQRGYLMRTGKIVVEGEINSLLGDPQVMELYFGG